MLRLCAWTLALVCLAGCGGGGLGLPAVEPVGQAFLLRNDTPSPLRITQLHEDYRTLAGDLVLGPPQNVDIAPGASYPWTSSGESLLSAELRVRWQDGHEQSYGILFHVIQQSDDPGYDGIVRLDCSYAP